jgi:hypothetical protein
MTPIITGGHIRWKPLLRGACRALHDRGSMLADPRVVLFCCSAMNAAKMRASNARPTPQPSRPPPLSLSGVLLARIIDHGEGS